MKKFLDPSVYSCFLASYPYNICHKNKMVKFTDSCCSVNHCKSIVWFRFEFCFSFI